jgi:hypothetical protein
MAAEKMYSDYLYDSLFNEDGSPKQQLIIPRSFVNNDERSTFSTLNTQEQCITTCPITTFQPKTIIKPIGGRTYNERHCVGSFVQLGTLDLQNTDTIQLLFEAPIPLWDVSLAIEYRSTNCSRERYDYQIVLGNGSKTIIKENSKWIEDESTILVPGRSSWNYKLKILEQYK